MPPAGRPSNSGRSSPRRWGRPSTSTAGTAGPARARARRSSNDMYERFTDRARKVMALANAEAKRFRHEYIGTEHILLGLVQEGSGVAANVLKNLDVDLPRIRLEAEKLVQPSPDLVTMF